MVIDLRIVFLALLLATAVLHLLRFGPVFKSGDLRNMFLDFLYIPTIITTVLVFGFLITRTDPMPLIRETGYQVGLQQLVNFENAIPDRLQDSINVQSVIRQDTDGDGAREWVVFYRYDLQNGLSPIKGVIYDSDRGNPPVVFPYQLQVPSRDYLSDQPTSLDFTTAAIVPDQNGENNTDVNEILISDNKTLSIFRFVQNSEPWDFPRDAPSRYQPIGFFRGTGGVSFNDQTKNVTVIDRDGFERSQLAVRSIYQLQPNNTYWATFDPLVLSAELAAPIISTVDFFEHPPTDIYNSPYPEKIVLGFYAATCGTEDNTLCLNRDTTSGWNYQDFLAADALSEAQRNNAGYFGLPGFSTSNLSVSNVSYFPSLETDPDLLVTGGGRDVVTGEQGQLNLVDITFSVNGRLDTLRYQMDLVNGQWKIVRRVQIEPPSPEEPVGPTAVISGPPSIEAGQAGTFDCSNSQPGSSPILTCTWKFNNFTEIGEEAFTAEQTREQIGLNVSTTPTVQGQLNVTLIVTDEMGMTATATKTVTVNSTEEQPAKCPTPQQPDNPCAPKW